MRLLGIYEGVDLELREGEPPGTIEYDLHVADPACLERIVVDCEGARSLAVEDDGSLRVETDHGVLRQSPSEPFAECGEDPTADPLGCKTFSKCP